MDESDRNEGAPDSPEALDRLALIRTSLAVERTFLAYLRSSLALIATGVTAIHFIPGQPSTWSGAILVTLGFLCLGYGALRFREVRRALSEEGRGGSPSGT